LYRSHRSVGRVPQMKHTRTIHGEIPPLIEDSLKIDYLASISQTL